MAYAEFFEAFKNYQETGHHRAKICLMYSLSLSRSLSLSFSLFLSLSLSLALSLALFLSLSLTHTHALRYVVVANMLSGGKGNPFDATEAKV